LRSPGSLCRRLRIISLGDNGAQRWAPLNGVYQFRCTLGVARVDAVLENVALFMRFSRMPPRGVSEE